MGEAHAYDVLVVGGGATGAGVLRDLARRGLRTLLVERGDYGTGTTGRYHGLLHSGGRYVAKDALAARECISENRILRRIAPASIEDTGGLFVATPEDPDDYVAGFEAACNAADVDCEEIPVAEALRREPALNPRIRRAFKLPDGSVEPWQLIESNIADARVHGSDAWSYQRLVGMERDGSRIVAATLRDERSGSMTRITPRFVVSCAGAWSGQIAAMVNLTVTMHPGKGTMLIFNQRMTDTVVNRCHKSSDGDIMVPVHTVAILGTTEQRVEDPDTYEITRDEVAGELVRVRVLHALLGGAEDRDRVDGDHDVAVGRLVAAIDHRVGHALVEDEHRALARVHRHGEVHHRGDLARPGTRARDHEAGRDARHASRSLVAERRRHDPAAVAFHAHQALIGPGVAAVNARVGDVGFDELPWLHGAIRQLEGAADARIERRLAPERLGDRDLLAVHVGGVACRLEAGDVVIRILGRGDEQAARVLDARGGDPPQDAVLGDAFALA